MTAFDPIPVLWLYGPPGVGKTTVAWAIYSGLTRAGTQAAYVDLDQLGICYPEPPEDPGRHRMKARNLAAVLANFAGVGARCVVVSGVVDSGHGVPADLLGDVALTVCRLRVDHDELTRRLLDRRGGPGGSVAEARDEAEALDARRSDPCVDTTGKSVAEVVRIVTSGWPGDPKPPARPPLTATGEDGQVLWLTGPTAVGKSTVGFTLYQRLLDAGQRAAYVDLDQLGFCTRGGHRLKAANLAALWQTYRTAGALSLTIVGAAENDAAIKAYADALPRATFTIVNLQASRDVLASRIARRARGDGWAQPGDPLNGLRTTETHQLADRAAREAHTDQDHGVDTDDRTVDEVADAVLAAIR